MFASIASESEATVLAIDAAQVAAGREGQIDAAVAGLVDQYTAFGAGEGSSADTLEGCAAEDVEGEAGRRRRGRGLALVAAAGCGRVSESRSCDERSDQGERRDGKNVFHVYPPSGTCVWTGTTPFHLGLPCKRRTYMMF